MEYTKGKSKVGNYCGEWLVEGPTFTVANCGPGAECKANAERLVQCWNEHNELVKACEVASQSLRTYEPGTAERQQKEARIALIQVLAKAEQS